MACPGWFGMKITKQTLEDLAAKFAASGLRDKIYFDEALPGFGIRFRSGSNKQVYVCRYEHSGIQRKITLGKAAVLSPDQAREMARRAMAETLLGIDPQARKAEERIKSRLTLRNVANQYLQAHASKLRPKSLREAKRYLLQSFRPLHAIPIHKITRRDIAVVLNDLAVRAPVAAGRGRATLSSFFVWARGEGLVEDNPVEGTNNPSPPVSRDRVLSDSELAAVWNACGDDAYGRIARLLILSGCRREEVGGISWGEMEDGVWTIPGSRTKNKRVLPLPGIAWRIIDGVPHRPGNDHLFGKSSRGYMNWAVSKKALDKRCQISAWRLHDLRRTVATRMADLGIQPHIVEAALNHASGHKRGVAGVYNRSPYAREVKNALAIWADYVVSIAQGDERARSFG